MRRFLISAYLSDWIEANNEDEAFDIMLQQILVTRRHEWSIECQDSETVTREPDLSTDKSK